VGRLRRRPGGRPGLADLREPVRWRPVRRGGAMHYGSPVPELAKVAESKPRRRKRPSAADALNDVHSRLHVSRSRRRTHLRSQWLHSRCPRCGGSGRGSAGRSRVEPDQLDRVGAQRRKLPNAVGRRPCRALRSLLVCDGGVEEQRDTVSSFRPRRGIRSQAEGDRGCAMCAASNLPGRVSSSRNIVSR
jgi:hypothetical protein